MKNKNLNTDLLIAILIGLIIIIISINQKNTLKKVSIVGTWKATEKQINGLTIQDEYIFNSDKTCVSVSNIVANNHTEESTSACTYKVTKDKLIITLTGETEDDYWEDENGNEVKTMEFDYVLNENTLTFDEQIYYKK